MLLNEVNEFYNKLLKSKYFSEDLRNKLKDIHDEVEYKVFIEKELLPLAKTMGYDNLSIDDILAYEHKKLHGLSEEELDSITGGTGIMKNLTVTFISALALAGGAYALQALNSVQAIKTPSVVSNATHAKNSEKSVIAETQERILLAQNEAELVDIEKNVIDVYANEEQTQKLLLEAINDRRDELAKSTKPASSKTTTTSAKVSKSTAPSAHVANPTTDEVTTTVSTSKKALIISPEKASANSTMGKTLHKMIEDNPVAKFWYESIIGKHGFAKDSPDLAYYFLTCYKEDLWGLKNSDNAEKLEQSLNAAFQGYQGSKSIKGHLNWAREEALCLQIKNDPKAMELHGQKKAEWKCRTNNDVKLAWYFYKCYKDGEDGLIKNPVIANYLKTRFDFSRFERLEKTILETVGKNPVAKFWYKSFTEMHRFAKDSPDLAYYFLICYKEDLWGFKNSDNAEKLEQSLNAAYPGYQGSKSIKGHLGWARETVLLNQIENDPNALELYKEIKNSGIVRCAKYFYDIYTNGYSENGVSIEKNQKIADYLKARFDFSRYEIMGETLHKSLEVEKKKAAEAAAQKAAQEKEDEAFVKAIAESKKEAENEQIRQVLETEIDQAANLDQLKFFDDNIEKSDLSPDDRNLILVKLSQRREEIKKAADEAAKKKAAEEAAKKKAVEVAVKKKAVEEFSKKIESAKSADDVSKLNKEIQDSKLLDVNAKNDLLERLVLKSSNMDQKNKKVEQSEKIDGIQSLIEVVKTYGKNEVPIISTHMPDKLFGIKNFGNSCYFNAAIQQCYRSPMFKQHLMNLRSNDSEISILKSQNDGNDFVIYYNLMKLFKTFDEVEAAGVVSGTEMEGYVDTIRYLLFSDFDQQDAPEFIRLLLDRLGFESGLKTLQFNITTQSSGAPEKDYYLALPLRPTIQECCTEYFKLETLMGQQRQRKISSLPQTLWLSLNRFRSSADGPIKLSDPVTLDETIDVRPFCVETEGGPAEYELAGVVRHVGKSARSGHYISYMRLKQADGSWQWVELNDDKIQYIAQPPELDTEAYMVRYERKS